MATEIGQRLKAAVFVDVENHTDLWVSALLQYLRRFDVVERHAYAAEWCNVRLCLQRRLLARACFQIHTAWSRHRSGARKNAADACMAWGILSILSKRPDIEVFVIVSGDAFFAYVIRELYRQGKRAIVVADPSRVSKELYGLADEYLPLGKWGRLIRDLHHLEQKHDYLTFGFTVRQSDIEPSELAELIHKRLVIQEEIARFRRGIRPEIRLNPQAHAVQAILAAAA
jgi:uncharacterized LabA/DUF88 family protein